MKVFGRLSFAGFVLACSVSTSGGRIEAAHAQDTTRTYMQPAWSPDGRWIAFVARPASAPGQADLYVVRSDGSQLRQVTDSPAWELRPSWSPDSRQLAFMSGDPREGWRLGLINVDGTHRRELPVSAGNVSSPSFAPRGGLIALEVGRGESTAVYTMRADGTDARALTPSTGRHAFPVWSPDGRTILYSYRLSRSGHWQLWTMNRDGSTPKQLTTEAADDAEFSPGGALIAFSSDRSGSRYEVFLMNADGTGQRSLTAGIEGSASAPAFSPDGKRIAFSLFRDGRSSIWVMDADGSNIHELVGS